jgi:hypothetical protein
MRRGKIPYRLLCLAALSGLAGCLAPYEYFSFKRSAAERDRDMLDCRAEAERRTGTAQATLVINQCMAARGYAVISRRAGDP